MGSTNATQRIPIRHVGPFAPLLPGAAFAAPNAPERCDMAPAGYQWFSLGDGDAAAVPDAAWRWVWGGDRGGRDGLGGAGLGLDAGRLLARINNPLRLTSDFSLHF